MPNISYQIYKLSPMNSNESLFVPTKQVFDLNETLEATKCARSLVNEALVW